MTLHDDNKGLQHYIEEIAQAETGMETAEMWQPARLRKAHPSKAPYLSKIEDPEKYKGILKRVVRIREIEMRDWKMFANHEAIGCDSERIFLVHPDDCGCHNAHVCEHEILTD